jgi:hypothetical protein
MTQHTEKAFEAAIEHFLIADGGYKQGDPNNFDRERCLDPTVLIPFIKKAPTGAKLKCDVFLIMYLISAARYTNAFILSYTLKKDIKR